MRTVALDDPYETFEYVLTFFNFCAGIVSTLLNVFVVYALLIRRGPSRAHGADMFVIGLSISELLSGLSLIASIIDIFLDPSWAICILQICFFQSSFLCSALFVTLMTSDRYFKIVFPFVYERVFFTDFYPMVISASVFVSAFTIGFMPAMGLGRTGSISESEWNQCSYLKIVEREYRMAFLALMFLPILTAVSFYTKIFRVARVHMMNIAKTQGRLSRVQRGRYVKMIFWLAGLYILFYMPPAVVNFLHDFHVLKSGGVQLKAIFHFSSLGIIGNTILNPILYAYTLPVVKNVFRTVLGLPDERDDLTLVGSSRAPISGSIHTESKAKRVRHSLWSDDSRSVRKIKKRHTGKRKKKKKARKKDRDRRGSKTGRNKRRSTCSVTSSSQPFMLDKNTSLISQGQTEDSVPRGMGGLADEEPTKSADGGRELHAQGDTVLPNVTEEPGKGEEKSGADVVVRQAPAQDTSRGEPPERTKCTVPTRAVEMSAASDGADQTLEDGTSRSVRFANAQRSLRDLQISKGTVDTSSSSSKDESEEEEEEKEKVNPEKTSRRLSLVQRFSQFAINLNKTFISKRNKTAANSNEQALTESDEEV